MINIKIESLHVGMVFDELRPRVQLMCFAKSHNEKHPVLHALVITLEDLYSKDNLLSVVRSSVCDELGMPIGDDDPVSWVFPEALEDLIDQVHDLFIASTVREISPEDQEPYGYVEEFAEAYLTQKEVEAIATSGANDAAVADVVGKYWHLLDAYAIEPLRRCANEIVCDTKRVENFTKRECWEYIIWNSAWAIHDREVMNAAD